jgi:hypothetical protein
MSKFSAMSYVQSHAAVGVGRNPDLVPDPNRLGGHLLVGHHCEA